jgi:hypothetical protein
MSKFSFKHSEVLLLLSLKLGGFWLVGCKIQSQKEESETKRFTSGLGIFAQILVIYVILFHFFYFEPLVFYMHRVKWSTSGMRSIRKKRGKKKNLLGLWTQSTNK